LHDLGELRLKDLDGLERLFQLVAPDLPRTFPPPRCVGAGVEGPSVTRSISKRALRVVVADDTALVREGVARLLAEAGFDIVATAADADELLQQVARFEPDVAVTDIKMPPAHADEGLTAARAIRRDHPGVGVIVLSQYLDSPYALRLLEAYPERVGYLLKERVHEVAVLGDAIRRVADGECVVDPTIASRLRNRLRAREPALD
jgi:DNA-binding NarL/FixJ family response regulator